MLKPSFRFFIIPLGAVATLATLGPATGPEHVERTRPELR